MNSNEILKFCVEKGLLLDKEVLNLFSEASDIESVKMIIEKVRSYTKERIITKKLFEKNKEEVIKIFSDLPKESQEKLNNLKIKLGLSIEITKEVSLNNLCQSQESQLVQQEQKISSGFSGVNSGVDIKTGNNTEKTKKEMISESSEGEVKILSSNIHHSKKLEVEDFVNCFRGRLKEMSKFLQERPEMENLVSINKIPFKKGKLSIIGLVADKRVTKNKNIIFEVEDLTGKTRVLVTQNNKELYEKAEEVTLDSVMGFKCFGNKEILFATDVVFPDCFLQERKKAPVEEYVLFTGDLHIGSKLFMEENFLKFIDFLNGKIDNSPDVEKIKYLVIAGDLIAGVGIYPEQEKELAIPDIEKQFEKAAELLGKIRRDIKIIIAPGNHDAIRIMEPQPMFDEKYAWPLYNLKNVILTGNPSSIVIGAKKGFSGFNILIYHGYSFHYYANNIPYLIQEKAVHSPEKLMKYLLKNRHLAPTHSSTLYFPSENDPLIIKDIPDIFVSGHTHKSAVSYYNNILVISSSTWESKTAFQERMGNEPDFCKVPMFNLKTRAVKILDFE